MFDFDFSPDHLKLACEELVRDSDGFAAKVPLAGLECLCDVVQEPVCDIKPESLVMWFLRSRRRNDRLQVRYLKNRSLATRKK